VSSALVETCADFTVPLPGAGRLAFPACLLGLQRCALSLRGFPGCGVARGFPWLCDPLSFTSPSKTRSGPCDSVESPCALRGFSALQCFGEFIRISSRVVFQRSPLRRSCRLRPVPPHSPEGECASAQRCQALSSFRLCRSSRLWRFAPHATVQVCCALLPAMGFERFRLRPPSTPCFHDVGSSARSSRSPSHPSEPFPRQQPLRVTASPFPLAVRSHFRFRWCSARPQGFAPLPSPFPCVAFPLRTARCSLGLGSSSRFSLRSECSVEPPRSASAVAVLLCTATTKVTATWTCCSSKRVAQRVPTRSPQLSSSEDESSDLPSVATGRAGLPTCASLPLGCSSQPLVRFVIPFHRPRWDPALGSAALQRPSQKEVALVSRVSKSRILPLRESSVTVCEAKTAVRAPRCFPGSFVSPKTLPAHRSLLACAERIESNHRSVSIRRQLVLAPVRSRRKNASVRGASPVVELPTFLRFMTSKISGLPHTRWLARSDFSVQPRIPEAARLYCRSRANFALRRRTAIVENSNGIPISHRVFHRSENGAVFGGR